MTDLVETEPSSVKLTNESRVREHDGSYGQRMTVGAGAGTGVPGHAWVERDWRRVVEQVRRGDCTPFLGPGASPGTTSLGNDIAREWAAEYGYPFADTPSIHDIAQYVSIVEDDRVLVRQRFARQLGDELPEPKYQDPTEPHALLARLPVSVHLTTNHDDFMSRALELANKQPTTAICPWYDGADSDPETVLPPDYRPQVDEPLVYHLHGRLQHPASLVLAEQDHIEFLTRVATDVANDIRRIVPPHVLQPLSTKPLLFVGYDLRDWSFRLLLHGFIGAVAKVGQRRHVSVQLALDPDTDGFDKQQRALEYLTHSFQKLNISVYWGSATEFCAELHRRLETP